MQMFGRIEDNKKILFVQPDLKTQYFQGLINCKNSRAPLNKYD